MFGIQCSNGTERKKRVPALEPLETRLQPSFLWPVAYEVEPNPVGMAVEDFNHDGKADLAAATFGRFGVSVLLGAGGGTFHPAQNHGPDRGARQVVAGDFNEDGHTDLAVTLARPNNSVGVLLGAGDGSFGDVTVYGVGRGPFGIATADFNGDGHLDLVTAGNGASPKFLGTVSILLGLGDGAFQDAVTFERGESGTFVAVADFNGDGHADLAVTNIFEGVNVFLGNGDGSFQDAPGLEVRRPGRLAVGDFDGDGLADLAAMTARGVGVLRGRGDGTFADIQEVDLAGRTDPLSLDVGDFNGDGLLDLVTVKGFDTAVVLRGQGDGTFADAEDYPIGFSYTPNVAVGDFDGNGYLDFAVSMRIAFPDHVAVLLNAADWDQPAPGGELPPSLFDVSRAPTPVQAAAVPVLLRGETREVSFFVSPRPDKHEAALPQQRQPVFDTGFSLPFLDKEFQNVSYSQL